MLPGGESGADEINPYKSEKHPVSKAHAAEKDDIRQIMQLFVRSFETFELLFSATRRESLWTGWKQWT